MSSQRFLNENATEMKKLSALCLVLLGLTLLPSCQTQDLEDIEPITSEVVMVDDQMGETEGEGDPHGTGGN